MAGKPIRLSFRIDAYQPDTIPMARLAEYLAEIAAMIGERASVHFVELKPGSLQVIHEVEYEAYPKVEVRAHGIRNGSAPADAMKAYRILNKKLAEDNTSGTYIAQDSGSKILDFPGIHVPKQVSIAPVEQLTTIDGQIICVGGRQISVNVPVFIETTDRVQACTTTRGMSKELRNFFLEEERRGDFTGSATGFAMSTGLGCSRRSRSHPISRLITGLCLYLWMNFARCLLGCPRLPILGTN